MDPRFIGRAGELRLISEFLARGFNCAIPEIDQGDDFLLLDRRKDNAQTTVRIQVKTGKENSQSNHFQFEISHFQLSVPTSPPIYFCFIFWKEKAPDFYFCNWATLNDMVMVSKELGTFQEKKNSWLIRFAAPQNRILVGKGRKILSDYFMNIDGFLSELETD